MPYSYTEVVGTGSPQAITVPEYLSQAHIKVYIAGVETTNFSWSNSNTVLVTAPAGQIIKVARNSSRNARVVDYTDGMSLTETVLDNDSKQAYYMAQEAFDALPTGNPGSLVGFDSDGNLTSVPIDSVSNSQITTAAFSNFRTDVFNGNGSTTVFTLSNDPGSVNNLDVSVGGISRVNGIDFNVVTNQLTFTNAPPPGTNNVCVRYGAALTAIPAGNYSGMSRTIPVNVAYAGTVTVNASLSNVFYIGTLSGNTTLAISNPTDGQTINIRFKQDATGSRTVTLPGTVSAIGAISPTPSSVTWLIATYVAADLVWEAVWSTAPSPFGQSLMSAASAGNARTLLGVSGTGSFAAMGANTDITSLNSPFIGAATATTQLSTDNSTKVATTAMVQAAISGGGGAGARSGANTDITSLASPFIAAATATTPATADNSTRVATTAMVQAAITAAPGAGLGVGQTWQNVTASRAFGSTYTNSTGKPIQVVFNAQSNSGNQAQVVTVGGVSLGSVGLAVFGASHGQGSFIVPNGATYSIAATSCTLSTWAELR